MGELRATRSNDGTTVGFEVTGSGPPMVLVHGGTADRTRWQPVLDRLAERHTVHAMDRRGRGLSPETDGVRPYSVQAEAADVAAVVEFAGEDVSVVAHSYGAICALEASLLCDKVGRMLLYEPPIPTPGHAVLPEGAQERLENAAVTGDAEAILRVFFREVIELPEVAIHEMSTTPIWAARLAAAPTMVREARALSDYRIPPGLERIDIPVRVLVGTESPHYYRPAAEAVIAALANADIVELAGQAHLAISEDPDQFLAAVFAFLGG